MTITIQLRDEIANQLQKEANQRGMTTEALLSETVETHWAVEDTPPAKMPRPYGLAKGTFQVPDTFFEPLPTELLDAFEGK
jgi:hypothetical protein